MKTLITITMIASVCCFSQAFAGDALELEPSINGDVSASGMYASQEEEDQALALLSEPCLYGDETASSAYTANIEQNIERNRSLVMSAEGSGVNFVSTR